MPKTTKRAAARRAAKIAKAHATELPKLSVKEAQRRAPGYKPPARGPRRYPWLTFFITIFLVALVVLTGYAYMHKLGPFAPAPVKKPVATSPCLKIVNQLTNTSPAPSDTDFKKTQHTYKAAPAMSINTKKVYCAGINTNKGLIVVELDPSIAPQTVNNFVYLAQHHFYDGMKFHRVVKNFVIQSGDPQGNGQGGPGYKIPAEPVKGQYTAGCIAMAKQQGDTQNSGSQFFICSANDQSQLANGGYNLFGHVVKGMDVVSKIQGPGDDPSQKNIKPDVINHLVVAVAP